MNEDEENIMLMATPKEIIGKMKYENGKPVAIGVLTEEEQQVFAPRDQKLIHRGL